jgi:type I site-specific restriction-modification system R (restriction) subunit
LAKALRDALPQAIFLAFTGTLITQEDRDTQAVFGHYVSVYDIQQAVEDGAIADPPGNYLPDLRDLFRRFYPLSG